MQNNSQQREGGREGGRQGGRQDMQGGKEGGRKGEWNLNSAVLVRCRYWRTIPCPRSNFCRDNLRQESECPLPYVCVCIPNLYTL